MATFDSTEFNIKELNFADALKVPLARQVNGLSISKSIDLPTLDPNELKEYVVIVKEGMTIDALEIDLERDTSADDGVDSSVIPDRPVNVANRREGSERQTHYFLTYYEAQALKNHPMVLDVELRPDLNPFKSISLSATTTGDFTKQAIFGTALGNTVNYGLMRCSSNTNNYGTGTTVSGDYQYIADGTGVDVVIMDTGILTSHPEFQDANGNSRIQQIDWYSVAGVAGTMPANFYTDDNGHGTATAGTVAGKTFGWAKNANIYVMNILGTSGTTIDTLTSFDLIKKFHQNKSIDSKLGFKRPTVVNASWGVSDYILACGGNYDPYAGGTIYLGYTLWGGNYRGTNWSGYNINSSYGMTPFAVGSYSANANVSAYLYQFAGQSSSYDAALTDLIAAGVHFVHSTGNERNKIELSTGPDYNNYANVITNIVGGLPVLTPHYYCRPSSPWASGCINVGATDVTSYDATHDKRAYFSNYGTATDMYAPGVGIVTSAIANVGNTYYSNSSFNQVNESGTSFSAPQVTGVLALFLQHNPGATPAVAKQWLTLNNKGCIDGVLYSSGLTNDYTNQASLSGGNNKFLFNPYFTGNVTLNAPGLTFSNGAMLTFRN